VDVFVETRNVTCVDPGTSHALGVRSSLFSPFQKIPTCVSWLGSFVRNNDMQIVNIGLTGASLGKMSWLSTKEKPPPSASVPSIKSVFNVSLMYTICSPTHGLGASKRDTTVTVGDTIPPLAPGSIPSTSTAATITGTITPAAGYRRPDPMRAIGLIS